MPIHRLVQTSGDRKLRGFSSRAPQTNYSDRERGGGSGATLWDPKNPKPECSPAGEGMGPAINDLSTETLDKVKGKLPIPPRSRPQKLPFDSNKRTSKDLGAAIPNAPTVPTARTEGAISVQTSIGRVQVLANSTADPESIQILNLSSAGQVLHRNSTTNTDSSPISTRSVGTEMQQRRLSRRDSSHTTIPPTPHWQNEPSPGQREILNSRVEKSMLASESLTSPVAASTKNKRGVLRIDTMASISDSTVSKLSLTTSPQEHAEPKIISSISGVVPGSGEQIFFSESIEGERGGTLETTAELHVEAAVSVAHAPLNSTRHVHISPSVLEAQLEYQFPEEGNPLSQANMRSMEELAPHYASVLVAEEHQAPKQKRQQEWLQVPELFYLFANIIELHELQQREKDRQLQGAQRDSLSLMSEWNAQHQQLLAQQNRLGYAAFDVDGVLLNPLLTQWSDPNLKLLVSEVTDSLKRSGSSSKDFEKASFSLLDAISSDKSGLVTYTYFHSLRQYVGNMTNHICVFMTFTVMTIIAIASLALLGVFGRTHIGVCVALSVVLGVVILLMYGMTTLILHHNTYADAAATFFREEALSSTQESINKDEEEGGEEDSFPFSDPWRQSFEDLADAGMSSPKRQHKDATVTTSNMRARKRTVGETDEGYISMISRSLQPADPTVLKQREFDRENALLMSGLNFEQHQLNVKQYQDQFVRDQVESNPLLADPNGLALTADFSSQESKRIMKELTENINITALIYCQDRSMAQSIASTLWERNFLIFNSSLASLDNAYHHGSERFKIFLLHAPDVSDENTAQLVSSWMYEKRPIFFFSSDVSAFPASIPLSARMETPLSSADVDTLLLSGIGVDEELNSTSAPTQFRIPEYTLGRRLGGGAFGNVFEAVIDVTGAKCAVKRMYLKGDDDADDASPEVPSAQLLEIAQEVEIMSSLSHPNIVQYLFFERNDNCISIFMELCSGGSLGSRIAECPIPDADEVKHLLTDIISAVVYLHNKRIVHRDIKPDNILFRDGRAKLTDFGTAVHKRGDLKMVKGTFAYMAPEILVGEPYGKACDMWSIGCIAADVLAVELPQRTLGLPVMCDYYRQMDLDAALEIECEVPVVRDFLLCCLQRNPNNRQPAFNLLNHDMLQPSNSALHRWVDIVRRKRMAQRAEEGLSDRKSGGDSLNSSIVFRKP